MVDSAGDSPPMLERINDYLRKWGASSTEEIMDKVSPDAFHLLHAGNFRTRRPSVWEIKESK